MSVRPVGAVLGAAAVVVASVVTGACGAPVPPLAGPGRLAVTDPPSTTAAAPAFKAPAPATASPTTPTAPPRTVPPGTSVTVTGPGGAQASVNAVSIVDPASPAHAYDAAGPGQRFVAVKLEIVNSGATPLQESTLNDTSIIASTGPLTPVVTEVAGCTSFIGGEFTLGPQTGAVDSCVTFELSTTATVKVIHFALGRDTAGQGSWAVP